MIHLAVKENEFACRLYAWQKMLPLYFATNQVSYAKFGSYYVKILKNLNQFHPGLRAVLLKKGLTAQVYKRISMQNNSRSKRGTEYNSRC